MMMQTENQIKAFTPLDVTMESVAVIKAREQLREDK
jgi:hypothetical protein